MSGRKNVLTPYHVIVAGDMSGDVTQATPTNIQYADNVSVQLNFTGTPTGTFEIQGSLDQSNWVPLVFSTSPVASGASGQILLDMNQLSFPYIRVFYDRTSGSGTLDAYISWKEV